MYHNFIPFTARVKIGRLRRHKEMKISKTYFEQQETAFKEHIDEFMFDETKKAEILRIFSLLKKNGAATFPEMNITIHEKYFTRKLKIKKDTDTNLPYVLIDNDKKLFYKHGMDENTIQQSFNSISFEQDYASPHRYLTNDHYFVGVMNSNTNQTNNKNEDSFGVTEGGIVVDVGAAEGNFSLSVIEKASKIYIIESDAKWCEALKHTFAPYREKIEIIQKHLSNTNNNTHTTLNELIKKYHLNKIDFLKMDIEGYEKQALQGGLENNNANFADINKMAICTYHNPQDAHEISNFASHHGYKTYLTKGYMYFPDYNNPPIRKAVLRAHK